MSDGIGFGAGFANRLRGKGFDCGCEPNCQLLERLQMAERGLERASENYRLARVRWAAHLDEIVEQAA